MAGAVSSFLRKINWNLHIVPLISAVIGGGLFSYASQISTNTTNLEIKKREFDTQLVLKALDQDDEARNEKQLSHLNILLNLGFLKDIDKEKWDQFVAAHPERAPRFFFSPFIWSKFVRDVCRIKELYRDLGIYEGVIDDNYDDPFIIATYNFQNKYQLGADGIFGPATYSKLVSEHEEKVGKLNVTNCKPGNKHT